MNFTDLPTRIEALTELRKSLELETSYWEPVFTRASAENPWFTLPNIRRSIQAICSEMLDVNKLTEWAEAYTVAYEKPVIIGVVMAGNLPLVGFADWLAVFISGQIAMVKCSDKDAILFPAMMQWLVQNRPAMADYTIIADRLKQFDAVIATGSNNTALYFEQYFNHVPHIIRRNRTSVAVVHNNDSDEIIRKLGDDVHSYFGLGCRNVSKIYLPAGFEPGRILTVWEGQTDNIQFNKYKNNFDYNLTLYLLNKVPFLTDNQIILVQDPALFSRIACVHYEYYDSLEEVEGQLSEQMDDIQCLVSAQPVGRLKTTAPGNSQTPGLTDYADGADTMSFIQAILQMKVHG